jgi:small subunit ribosomal protein S6e
MTEFKTVIADPKNKKTHQKILPEEKSNALVGKYVGEEIDGIFLDLPGYRLKITGGSDKSGVPMRGDIDGSQRRRLLMKDSVGFNPVHDGQRKRKLVRGRTLSSEVSQVNLKVVEYGPKTIEELLKPEEA